MEVIIENELAIPSSCVLSRRSIKACEMAEVLVTSFVRHLAR